MMRISFFLNAAIILVSSSCHPFYAFSQKKQDTISYVQKVNVESGKIDTLLIAQGDFEAPNWHPENYLIMNYRGKMYKLDIATRALTVINTGSVDHLMDDHGISPDGKWLGLTDFDSTGNSG